MSDILVIWVCGEAEYFCAEDWTGQIALNRFNKFAALRMRLCDGFFNGMTKKTWMPGIKPGMTSGNGLRLS